MVWSTRVVIACLFALVVPARARAQDAAPAPWSLYSVRYDSRTSDFIYAAYGYGQSFAMVGVLHNPRSGYSELLGAVGRTFTIDGGPAQFAAVGLASIGDAWYSQVYYLPTAHPGTFWVRATSELYVPFSRAGTLQFAVSPVSATVAVTRFLEAGAAMDVSAARGDATSIALGPELRFALPKAVLGADLQEVLNAHSSRLRVFFLAAF